MRLNFYLSNRLILGALAGALILAGFGCKGLSKEEQAALKPITLEYWTVFDDVDALRAQIEKYRADRPYLTVNVRQLREGEFYQRFIEALAEDQGPDIVSLHHRALGTYVSKLAPLPERLTDTTVRIIKGRFSTDTIITPSERPALTPEDLERDWVQVVARDVVRDGKIYGLPLSLDTMALYYNKDLLDRAGIPEPPKTWEEFQAAVKKLTKFDRQTNAIAQSGAALGTGSTVPGSEDILYLLWKQSGLTPFAKNGQAIFDREGERRGESPAAMVLDFYTDFANPTRDTYSWNESRGSALDSFINGSLAFFFGYSYHYSVVAARAPQLNFVVLPLLQLNPETPVNVANYWVQSVVGKSKQPGVAWALVDWLARSDATREYLEISRRPTAQRALIGPQREERELRPFVDAVLIAENWYRGKDYAAARRAIHDLLREWLEVPDDPNRLGEWREQVLRRAASKINQTL